MSARGTNPLLYLYRKDWLYSAKNQKIIVLYWVMFIIAQSMNVFLLPWVMASIIDVIAKHGINNETLPKLSWFIACIVFRSLLFWLFHGPARVIQRTNAFTARIEYRRYLLTGILTMPLSWHTEHHSGDTIDKIEKGTSGLFAFSEKSHESIYYLVQFLGSYSMLIYLSHSAAYAVLILMPLSIWITLKFDAILIPQYQTLNRAENAISESVFDTVSNISTVAILRVEKLVFEAIMRKVEEPLDLFKKNARLTEIKWALTAFCCNSMIAIVFILYVWQHFGTGPGTLIRDVALLLTYLDQIGTLFFNFAGNYGDVVQRKTKVSNAEELTADFIPQSFTNHVLPPQWQTLTIDGLNFSYHTDGSEYLHLDNVSLSISKGERIAFIGESGSGKTSLLKVMRDLYQPRSLTLSVDGTALPGGFESISRAIALIPQNPEMFSTTIEGNITLGKEYSVDTIRRYTDMACFTDVVDSLPNGLASSIKEKGVNLSGGQQQRLALSRGLLACRNKDIVLLDEPTSSLDPINEMNVYENIFREFKGKTIISSVHRLHLLPLFDRICLFDSGRIVATGTLSELLEQCPEFQTLWQKYNQHQQTTT